MLSASSLLGIIISVAHQISDNHFVKNFYFSEISKEIEAYNAYYIAFVSRIAEATVALAVTVVVASFLWDIFNSHTDLAREELKREHKSLRKAFVNSTAFMFTSALFTSASSIFYGYAQPFYYKEWYYSYSLLISVLFNVIFAFAAWRFLDVIKSSVKRRYSLYL